MIETIKIEFTEQAKAVVANTKIEVEYDITETAEDIMPELLKRAKSLFDEAHKYAELKTKMKLM
jgi:hypothetical protein